MQPNLLIDSHAHLDSSRYGDDLTAVLERAWLAGVGAILAIGIGEGPAEMGQALDICRRYNPPSGSLQYGPAAQQTMPQLYASAGIYPHNTHEADADALARLDGLLAEPEVIACGEIGLDRYHEGSPHPVQKAVFIQQMEIAAARKRPILIHCRPKDGDNSVWDELFALMNQHWRPHGLGGVLHCFSGELAHAEAALDLGFLISFAGHLTYPKSGPLRDVAAQLPVESLLVETDAPFLAPHPHRGQRNEPAWVAHTAEFLAELRGLPLWELAHATTKNFRRLFQLPSGMGN